MAATQTKPGFKTSEFWLALAAMLLGAVIASGAMDSLGEEHWASKIVGGAVAVLAALGYAAARAKVKANDETPSK